MPAPELIQRRASTSIRRAIGLTPSRLRRVLTHPDLLPVDGISRIVHGDLSSMLVADSLTVLSDVAPPLDGRVAQHSRYKSDPRAVSCKRQLHWRTTYGSKTTAHATYGECSRPSGGSRVADDGATYFANDPHLLAWCTPARCQCSYAATKFLAPSRCRKMTLTPTSTKCPRSP